MGMCLWLIIIVSIMCKTNYYCVYVMLTYVYVMYETYNLVYYVLYASQCKLHLIDKRHNENSHSHGYWTHMLKQHKKTKKVQYESDMSSYTRTILQLLLLHPATILQRAVTPLSKLDQYATYISINFLITKESTFLNKNNLN
jgi:hypothetical protein